MTDFEEYAVNSYDINSANMESVKRLHELVMEFKKDIFTNHNLQDFLLNRGYLLDDEKRPESFFDITTKLHPREKMHVHLNHFNEVFDKATKIQIEVIKSKGIVVKDNTNLLFPNFDYEPLISVEDSFGIDYETIEKFQEGWFENADLLENIRAYGNLLESCFDEFNNNLIIDAIRGTMPQHIPDDFEDIVPIKNKVVENYTDEAFTPLYNAYYSAAERMLPKLGKLYVELSKNSFSSPFILPIEDEKELVNALVRSRNYY